MSNPYDQDNIDDLLAFSPQQNDATDKNSPPAVAQRIPQSVHSPPRGSSAEKFRMPLTHEAGQDEIKENHDEAVQEESSLLSSVQSVSSVEVARNADDADEDDDMEFSVD